jgi:hypothetical protein
MNFEYRFARATACLLLAAAGVNAHAQLPLQAAAADPQASVPATRYQSALDYRPPAAPATSPDRNWVASNETVAATNSMALTMKPMAGQAQHDHAAMHGMNTNLKMRMKPEDSPAMCSPAGAATGQGMQCKAGGCCGEGATVGGKAGPGKMPCCDNCPCMNKMKKDKDTP